MPETTIDPKQFLQTNEERPPYGETQEQLNKQSVAAKLIAKLQGGESRSHYLSEEGTQTKDTNQARNRAINYLMKQLEGGAKYADVKIDLANSGMAGEISDILEQMDQKFARGEKLVGDPVIYNPGEETEDRAA